mgnify:CR=1 FL=1
MNKNDRIFVAGHNGLVGSAILRKLKDKKFKNIVTASKKTLDLRNSIKVNNFLNKSKVNIIFICSAKVGGIKANNSYPAEFIFDNLMIQNNLINCAYKNNIKKLLFLGSSCIYPKVNKTSLSEKDLLTGKLEPTNEPYAIAKIAGIKMCESYNRQYGTDYRSVMPTNTYGPNDKYDPENSHVIPALIHKFHNAKINKKNKIKIWGSGKALREFIYVDDLADACIFIMNINKIKYQKNIYPMQSHVNIGSGFEVSIKQLTKIIAKIVNYKGQIIFDNKMPDGTLKKTLNSNVLNNMGFKANTNIEQGLIKTYKNYLNDS